MANKNCTAQYYAHYQQYRGNCALAADISDYDEAYTRWNAACEIKERNDYDRLDGKNR